MTLSKGYIQKRKDSVKFCNFYEMRSAHLCFLFKGTIIDCFDREEYYESRYECCNKITMLSPSEPRPKGTQVSILCMHVIYIFFSNFQNSRFYFREDEIISETYWINFAQKCRERREKLLKLRIARDINKSLAKRVSYRDISV